MQKSITSNEKKITNSHESLMDVDDVAAYLKLSRSWVYQHSASGRLPSRKIGGSLRFIPSEIREWALANQSRNPAAWKAAGQATPITASDRQRTANG